MDCELPLRRSCAWTLDQAQGVVSTMDDQKDTDLVAHLCTQAGIIMEDASVVALKVGSAALPERASAIQSLEIASRRIGALINAAIVLSD